jgi:TrmH family RNA methyltransferase
MIKKITSLQHSLVKHLVKLRKNSDYRFEHKTVVVEGIKLIQELLAQYAPKQIITMDETLVPKGVDEKVIVLVNEEIINKITGMTKSEGILAEFPMPAPADLSGKKYLIALDGVSDPGNMGALLRTALALGWEGAYILEGSCDPFNEKAIRASRGAVFRLPMAIGHWDQLDNLIQKNRWKPIAADLEGEDLHKMPSFTNGILLVLSNEASGLSKEAKRVCEKVTIPMPGDMESLNVAVAGGILMYNLKQ